MPNNKKINIKLSMEDVKTKLIMTKTNKKLDNKSAFGRAFIFPSERLEWKEDPKNKLKINDNNRGLQMPCHLHTLSGSEHPELFIHWLREFRDKVLELSLIHI